MPESFGKYDVYATSGSIYCYVGTNVLRNHFGIRNADELKRIEADITTIRQLDLLSKPVTGRFPANHLCSIHRYLFGDIYPFAGHYRRESIAKGPTIFENAAEIERKLKKLLNQLKDESFMKQTAALKLQCKIVGNAHLSFCFFLSEIVLAKERKACFSLNHFAARKQNASGHCFDWILSTVCLINFLTCTFKYFF